MAVEKSDQSHQGTMDGLVEHVQESANRTVRDIEELKDLKATVQDGTYVITAKTMETETPYPQVTENGHVVGRELPFGFAIPSGTSTPTLKKIMRDGRPLTDQEAAGFAKLHGTTPAEEKASAVAVRASITKDEIPYASNTQQFKRFERLTKDMDQAAAESIPAVAVETQAAEASFTGAVDDLNKEAKRDINSGDPHASSDVKAWDAVKQIDNQLSIAESSNSTPLK